MAAAGRGPVAGCDEVGRGAWAGPVSVGLVVVDPGGGPPPPGLRDSKLLTPARRSALVPAIDQWVVASAVGHAEAAEIDRWGLVVALRLAACRALGQLATAPAVVLLDGTHDWLAGPVPPSEPGGMPAAWPAAIEVVTEAGADRRRASVAAASVLAKVARDELMRQRAGRYPGYGWEANKGYGTAAHRCALASRGPSPEHRTSWQPMVGRHDGTGG